MNIQDIDPKPIRAVFSDLDDTITDRSKILASTYQALWDLKTAGFWLVVVSGRPAGWADALMRLWPIDQMIFENGAGIVSRVGERLMTQSLATQSDRSQERLRKIFDRLKARIPKLKCASDQFCRKFDFTIDYAEEKPFLDAKTVDSILSELRSELGITDKLSSIHINYWEGSHTKLTACNYLIENEGAKWGAGPETTIYVGDSPNDEPLFGYFPNAVGVANVVPFLGKMKNYPRYVTNAPGGRGFEQIAKFLVASRSAP